MAWQKEVRRVLAGHHAQMKPVTHRCCQCRRLFVPNPRLGDRQVTCGRPDCQRLRHADRCRRWHKRNRGLSSQHYEDVVKPFRAEQPSYQRRWRLARRLREIRETIAKLVGVVEAQLSALVERGRSLSSASAVERQTGVMAGQSLHDAVAAAIALSGALAQIALLDGQLGAVGL